MSDFETIKITDIKPAIYNPRTITDENFDKLKQSLNQYGLVDPIVINLKNENTIIGGHGWDRIKDKKEPIVFFKHTGKSKGLDENEVYEEKRTFYKDIVANTGDNAYGDAYSVRDDNMKY